MIKVPNIIAYDTSWTKKLRIEIDQNKIDDPMEVNSSMSNVASINSGASYPVYTHLKIASISWWVITDEREKLITKPYYRKWLDPRSLYYTNADWLETKIPLGTATQVLTSAGATLPPFFASSTMDIATLDEVTSLPWDAELVARILWVGNVKISTNNFLSNLPVRWDASDWSVTISTNTTLTEDKYYNILTVNSGVTLNTWGYRIYAKQVINNGTIERNGNNGANGTGWESNPTSALWWVALSESTTWASGAWGIGGGTGGNNGAVWSNATSISWGNGGTGKSWAWQSWGTIWTGGAWGTGTQSQYHFSLWQILNATADGNEQVSSISLIAYEVRRVLAGGTSNILWWWAGGGGGWFRYLLGTPWNDYEWWGGWWSWWWVVYIQAETITNNWTIRANGGNWWNWWTNAYFSWWWWWWWAGGTVVLVYKTITVWTLQANAWAQWNNGTGGTTGQAGKIVRVKV